jgi:zinc protease
MKRSLGQPDGARGLTRACISRLLVTSVPVWLVTAAVASAAAPTVERTNGAIERAVRPPRHPDELTLSPLRFAPNLVEVETLACGIPVFLSPNHDLPLCDFTVQFRMGRHYVPVGDLTVCAILSRLWRQGGTRNLSPDSLDARLAALSADMSASVGTFTGGVSVDLASEDIRTALPLWRDVTLYPRFDAERLSKAKADLLKDIQGINNDPSAIASAWCDRLGRGENHPAAHVATRAEIEAVSDADLRRVHDRFAHPQNACIGVGGDFDQAEMLALLDQIFGGWPGSPEFRPPVQIEWTSQPKPGLYLLRGDYEQSQVGLSGIFPDLNSNSPDAPAAEILSFGFGYGRVFYRTRAEGLSYGAAIMLQVGEDETEIRGFGGCRGEATGKLLRAFAEELARLKKEPLTQDELETARIFMIGGEVRSMATPSSVVWQQVENALRGRPRDYGVQRLNRLREAGTADMARLGQKYMAADQPKVVLVLGNPADFDVPLDSLGLGPVTELTPIVFGE